MKNWSNEEMARFEEEYAAMCEEFNIARDEYFAAHAPVHRGFSGGPNPTLAQLEAVEKASDQWDRIKSRMKEHIKKVFY